MPVWLSELVVSVRGYLLFFMCALLIALPGLISADESVFELHYQIDRSAVPALNEYDLTLIISVGDATEISVRNENGEAVEFFHIPEDDLIMVTSDANELIVELHSVTKYEDIGEIHKAPLKGNRKWAWSHSFDDNHFLDAPIDVMLAHDLPATMYIVAGWIDSGYEWEGDLTTEDIHQLIDKGWSVGNHTMSHDNNCNEDQPPSNEQRRDEILEADQVLNQIINQSNNSDFKVLSFAVPCGGENRFEDYHEIILEMRDAGVTDILFGEGGHERPFQMDVSDPFDIDMLIKRDQRLDGNGHDEHNIGSDSETIIDLFDSMHEETSQMDDQIGSAVWYNSFSHNMHLLGDNSTKLNEVATYFVDTYGKNGSDEAWMAPADVIYSYLLNRDLSRITLVSEPVPIVTPSQSPTFSVTSTPIPTTTPIPNATTTRTIPQEGSHYPATSTPLPTIGSSGGEVVDHFSVFLPLIVSNE